jgi:hypothetical protein
LPETELRKSVFECRGGVLAASVGVEDKATLGAPARHGTIERA